MVSVSDRTGVADLSAKLNQAGYGIYATAGTASEMPSDLVAGSLRDLLIIAENFVIPQPEQRELIAAHIADLILEPRPEAPKIDVVCVNLKSFKETAEPERQDRGGLAMLRAGIAVKGLVIASPDLYPQVSDALATGKHTDAGFRAELADEAQQIIAAYESA